MSSRRGDARGVIFEGASAHRVLRHFVICTITLQGHWKKRGDRGADTSQGFYHVTVAVLGTSAGSTPLLHFPNPVNSLPSQYIVRKLSANFHPS